MIPIQSIPFRRRRARAAVATPPVPTALTLVSASYDSGEVTLTLAFDRAIDIDALNGSAIVVDDPIETGNAYDATGTATLIDAMTIQLGLNTTESAGGSEISLTASAGNGIVATSDGAAWAGVSGVELPFGV